MIWHRTRTDIVSSVIALVASLLFAASPALAQSDLERFDGSFRLETGEVVTGGYMIEGGKGRWVYMDTENLDRGGIFERHGDTLRSLPFPGADPVEIRFIGNGRGGYDEILWRQERREWRGERVHPHTSRVVRFTSADGIDLTGRLLLPGCAGPHPVVVTVHGSGPVDRHGGVFHTFFLKHGVAVLAYDKRGYSSDPEAWREPDLADLSADAAAAVRFVAELPEIDEGRIGIWGSSQGGWVVPRAALDAPETDFIILRAGAAVSEAETNLHEVLQEARAAGLDGLDLDYAMDLRREIYRAAIRGAPIEAADSLAAPYLDEEWYHEAFGEGPISELWSDHWWAWAGRNLDVASAPDVARFAGPVLWFLAEEDEAVPLIPTRAALERAFENSPGNDHELLVIEDAPHSFFIADGESTRYAGGFFSGMAGWMAARGYTNASCRKGD